MGFLTLLNYFIGIILKLHAHLFHRLVLSSFLEKQIIRENQHHTGEITPLDTNAKVTDEDRKLMVKLAN